MDSDRRSAQVERQRIWSMTRRTFSFGEVISINGNPSSIAPFWTNGFFANLDAASLVEMLLRNRPLRYLEIGSGNSTKFARYAIDYAKLPTRMISVDPQPRAEIDSLCDESYRLRLEDCDLTLFDQLDRGDILFFRWLPLFVYEL